MENRILEVFYGTDGKPYKDQERSVLFPVVGNEYQGANDFTHIRFYYQRLCGEDNTLVAVFKNAKGELGCQPLSTSTDSTRGEKYALLPISEFLTKYKGDIYIALQCYRGDANGVVWDDEHDIWVINTEVPTIRSTANIKMSVNYAPMLIGSGEEEPLTLQKLLSKIAEKSDIDDVIMVVNKISTEDLSGYDEGQLFYDKFTDTYYKKTSTSPYYAKALSGAGVLGAPHILCRVDDNTLNIDDIAGMYGDSVYLVLRYLDKDYLFFAKKVSNYTCVAFDIEEQRFYKATNVLGSALPQSILLPANKIEIASKKFLTDNYVPYSGANADVDLGTHTISAKEVHLPRSKIYTDTTDDDATLLDGKFVYDNDYLNYKEDERSIASVKYALQHSLSLSNDSGVLDEDQYAYVEGKNGTITQGGNVYRFLKEDTNDIYYACFDNDLATQSEGTDIEFGRILKISKTADNNTYGYATSRVEMSVYSKAQAKSTFATDFTWEIDNTTYVMTFKLKNANGSDLRTRTLDLPLESIVSSATYYDTYTYDGVTYTKVIVITLSTTSVPTIVPVGDLISGLEKEACVELSSSSGTLTQEQMNTLALDNASIKFGGSYYHKLGETSFAYTMCVAENILGTMYYGVVSNIISYKSNTGAYSQEIKQMTIYDSNQIDTKVSNLQGQIDTNSGDIDDLEGDIADIQGDLTTIDGRLDNHDTEIAKLKKDVDYALKYPLLYGQPTTDTEEEVGLTTSQLPATTLPKGLINYVGGMSQKVNQLVSMIGNVTNYGLTLVMNADGTLDITGTYDGTAYYNQVPISTLLDTKANHKYLVIKNKTTSVSWGVGGFAEKSGTINAFIHSHTSDFTTQCTINPTNGEQIDISGIRVGFTDLTDIYGAGNEPSSTSDARIKWLIHHLTENPDYDEGSIVNAPVEKIVSKGFNIWDEEWELGALNLSTGANEPSNSSIRSKNYIRLAIGVTYYVKFPNPTTNLMYACLYDENENFLYARAFNNANGLTLSNTEYAYMRFYMASDYGTTYNRDICINISGTMNGTYKPYVAPSEYPIPAEVQAIDGYGLGLSGSTTNKTDLENKKFVKKVVEVTINAENIVDYLQDGSNQRWQAVTNIIPQYNPAGSFGTENVGISSNYLRVDNNNLNWLQDKTIAVYTDDLAIRIRDDSITTLNGFKALCPIKIVYEIAEPVETDISEYIDRDFPNENLIDTYQGGEVEFENDNDMGVPYSLTYQYKVE